MSADNWAVCPKCNKEKTETKAKLLLEAGKAYGKIPPLEYLAAIDAANKPIETPETLREDFQIGVDTNGTFSVDYGCSCRECGFEFRFEFSKNVKPD